MTTTSSPLEQQVAQEEERHSLLEALTAKGAQVEPDASLEELRELWRVAGPPADLQAKIEERRRNEEAEDPDRELEVDPDTEQPATVEETAPPLTPDPDGHALFDSSDYEREDLAIPKVDGNQVDRLAIKFAGEVFLDRSDPADVALYNKLRLGSEITLMIEGRVSGTGAKGATDRDGDLDVVVGQKAVKVATVYIPAIKATASA